MTIPFGLQHREYNHNDNDSIFNSQKYNIIISHFVMYVSLNYLYKFRHCVYCVYDVSRKNNLMKQ